MHGRGTLFHDDGIFEGYFRKGEKVYGTEMEINRTVKYIGEFKDNKPDGLGISYQLNGTKQYIGEWLQGFMHGIGAYWKNGRVYEGFFNDGRRSSTGNIFLQKDGKSILQTDEEWIDPNQDTTSVDAVADTESNADKEE